MSSNGDRERKAVTGMEMRSSNGDRDRRTEMGIERGEQLWRKEKENSFCAEGNSYLYEVHDCWPVV